MSTVIRPMEEKDRSSVMEMMQEFYASPAVFTNGSAEIFQADIDHCLSACPYIDGYIFQSEDRIQGYAMVAKSFSAEFGKPCIWIEDLYLKPEYRGQGIGSSFFPYVQALYPGHVIRLEAEPGNDGAIAMYLRNGFTTLPYRQLIIK